MKKVSSIKPYSPAVFRCSMDNPQAKLDIITENFDKFCELIERMEEGPKQQLYEWVCEEIDDDMGNTMFEEQDQDYFGVAFNALDMQAQESLME